MGYSAKLVRVPNETSQGDVEEHGYICLKSSAGDGQRRAISQSA